MSSNEIPVDVLQRVGRFRKLFNIGVRTEKGESLTKDDIDFLNQLAFTMARELINGVQLPIVPISTVLGDKSVESKLREIKTIEIQRVGTKEYVENPNSIYFY